MGTTNTNILFECLKRIREAHGHNPEASLPDETIKAKIAFNCDLRSAILKSAKIFDNLRKEYPELIGYQESKAIELVRSNTLNFYPLDAACPYIPLASQGPWIVTFHGGVIYTSGGYGILGFGHNPDFILEILGKDQTMANIMTPNFSQYRLTRSLLHHIGLGRECPYHNFALMNSGSEAIEVATRISDAHAKTICDTNGTSGKDIKYLGLKGSFHGRTLAAAQASDSSHNKYRASLASFKNFNKLVTVEPNNLEELTRVFSEAKDRNIYYELMLLEPVMGEGRAGYSITPEFYKLARKLTTEHQTLLLVDSVQAGLRAHGVMSIVDYPGFEGIESPDLEAFAKAINGGQYPVSVLALTAEANSFYQTGLYGNTMTGNPRGLDLAAAVLKQMTPELRANIVQMGLEFKNQLLLLKQEFPLIIEEVLGQGLLLSAQINKQFPVEGDKGLEQMIRQHGLNVIHSSGNRLRFTPWFHINKEEINLICTTLRETLAKL